MTRPNFLIFAAVLSLFAASNFVSCSQKAQTKETIFTAVLNAEPQTLDPALNVTIDGATYLYHSFEGLYTYKNDGKGGGVLVPGQAAAEPVKESNPDGTVSYTFKLRDGLKWSDGAPLTAADFVYSWQREVSPQTAADYSYMFNMVVNANDIIAGKKPTEELGIHALDDKTLKIDLTYDCPYFLQIAAFPAGFPVRRDIIEKAGDQWTFNPANYISNGPYKLVEHVTNSYLLYEKNPYYYDAAKIKGPDKLKFELMDDANAALVAYKNGSIDYTQLVPVDETAALLASGDLKVVPTLGIYYVTYNNNKAPFNDARVRRAFSLAIDRNYIVEKITRTGEKPAGAFVPPGIPDVAPGSDFRAVGGDYFSVAKEDYDSNITQAKSLLAQAGYPDGKGFPVVEYTYAMDPLTRAIADALQNMWKENLGVNVTLHNQDYNVFIENSQTGNYTFARDRWTADFIDPITFLDVFLSNSGNNDPQYRSSEYDDIIAKSQSTAVPEVRIPLLHQAEDMLLKRDAVICPVYYYTLNYLMKSKWSGLYNVPLGFFFFEDVTGK